MPGATLRRHHGRRAAATEPLTKEPAIRTVRHFRPCGPSREVRLPAARPMQRPSRAGPNGRSRCERHARLPLGGRACFLSADSSVRAWDGRQVARVCAVPKPPVPLKLANPHQARHDQMVESAHRCLAARCGCRRPALCRASCRWRTPTAETGRSGLFSQPRRRSDARYRRDPAPAERSGATR
jgi:hypothetical protein